MALPHLDLDASSFLAIEHQVKFASAELATMVTDVKKLLDIRIEGTKVHMNTLNSNISTLDLVVDASIRAGYELITIVSSLDDEIEKANALEGQLDQIEDFLAKIESESHSLSKSRTV
jgi:hypothetical protein